MNPSNLGVALTKCYFCGNDAGIAINTRLTPAHARNVEKMHGMVVDMTPCSECSGHMKKGVILITIDDKKSEKDWNKPPPCCNGGPFIPNPYRTGGFFVITDDAVRRIFHPEAMAAHAIKHRWMFIEHEAAEQIGLFSHAKQQQEKV
jgi:hypothetical protein